jgi:hypothetical protein
VSLTVLLASIAVSVIGCGAGVNNEGSRVDIVTRPIEAVQQDYTETWMSVPGVIGTAIGLKDNEKVIKVLVVKMTDEIRSKIPATVEGYRIVMEETGEIRALNSESE